MTASPDDHAVAATIAAAAGEHLVRLKAQLLGEGRPAKEIGRAGDREAHALIVDALAAARPRDAVLSEEAAAETSRLQADRIWIVDPLDGTREYGEPDMAEWAVHVALVSGGRPIAAAVALPALARTYATAPAPTIAAPGGAAPRILVSRSRPPAFAGKVAEQLGGTVVPMGSAGAKAMAVVRGDGEIYLHAGGQYEWDSCAPAAVAAAAGLHASRIDGTDLRYNRPDPYLPDLLICRPELAARALAAIAAADAA